MKKLFLITILLTLWFSKNSEVQAQESTSNNLIDTLFYYSDTKGYGKKSQYHLFNLLVSGISDGLLVNGSRTGLGNDNPTGKSFTADSLYFQMLRIFSVFDWEFVRGLYYEKAQRPLPPMTFFSSGYFPSSFHHGKGCSPSPDIHRKDSQTAEKKIRDRTPLLHGLRL